METTDKEFRKATHTGDLRIGDVVIPCAVLEDGTRVLWQQGFLRAIGRTGRAVGKAVAERSLNLPVFLRASNLKPFISSEILKASTAIPYKPIISSRGGVSFGYRADLLPMVCNVFLDAADHNALKFNQQHIYKQCKILVRGFGIVGINALVDEATGYQEVRDRKALQLILEKYIGKELAAWERTFPNEFYQNLYKLRDWQFKSVAGRRPMLVGKLTMDIVYQRLAPGVLKELREKMPRNEGGKPKGKLFQMLTPDYGHPKLREHLSNVTVLMKASSNWPNFYRLLQRALPKYGDTLELPFPDETELE
jgi:hypothetical protein